MDRKSTTRHTEDEGIATIRDEELRSVAAGTCRKSGKGQQEYFVLTLKEALISG